MEFIGCLFWVSLLLHYLIERYRDFGKVKETYITLLISVMDAMLVSPFFFLAGFYILLHVWLNISSELLRFADRKFYEVSFTRTSILEMVELISFPLFLGLVEFPKFQPILQKVESGSP